MARRTRTGEVTRKIKPRLEPLTEPNKTSYAARGPASLRSMPSGNGVVQVLAWGNATIGGLSFYVRSPLAMHTDSALYTIGRVDVSVSPNPLADAAAYVNQTHNLEDGSITLLAGGKDFASSTLSVSLYTDANSPTVMVTVASVTPVSIGVNIISVRPVATSYQNDFYCNGAGVESTAARPSLLLLLHSLLDTQARRRGPMPGRHCPATRSASTTTTTSRSATLRSSPRLSCSRASGRSWASSRTPWTAASSASGS